MALFQIFNGLEGDLSTDFTKVPFHEGYAYFCKDTGAFYIDAIVNGVNTRVPISTHGLIDENGDLIDYDQFLQVEDGEALRDELKTQVFTVTLATSEWQNRQITKEILGLRCGSGNTPPLIVCTSGSSDYAKITSAVATPAESSTSNGNIVFTHAQGATITTNISLMIIDFG